MPIKPQSIRSGVTIYVNGKQVDKPEILELSNEWNERQETLFKKTLKDGGEITIKGVHFKVIPQEKILNYFGEKDPKHIIVPEKSFLIGDRITDIQSGAAAGIKNLFLIVNPKMLEVNENLMDQPLQSIFIPLNGLKEFLLIKELQDEN